jgi:hypothetical protein
MYFSTYEYCLKEFSGKYQIPLSAFLGTSSSGFIATPLSVYKKRIQVQENNLEKLMLPLHAKQWLQLYLLNVVNKFPKAIVKYSIYEPLLLSFSCLYPKSVAGLLSALISSFIAALLFEPLEVKKTYTTIGKKTNYSNIYNGLRWGVLSSVLRNSIGHALLENFAPR